ncbi:sensor histidine kinase [Aliarcobacter cryaerophilus]|uniref:sensor histidine kinase n=1 Tax=Aliarcobacter cryaerophilus TaxID=28198 RepID=UPI0011DF9AF0|nr:sensor histidine kinase [Aliarcobacter cryaerophilus]
MKVIKIERVLNKTDLGISGKNGCEIALSSNIKSFFKHIEGNTTICFKDLKTNEILKLTKKIERSEKLTGKTLKKYFNSKNLLEGDILEIYLIEENKNYSYYINFRSTNYLIFKRNNNLKSFYSLSSIKLIDFISKDKNNLLNIKLAENIKLRDDGNLSIQHYNFKDSNLKYDLFYYDIENNKIIELDSLTTFSEKELDSISDEITLENLTLLFAKNITFKKTFNPKARLILQVGDRLIANEKIAISEIIKNSYDADARNVTVEMNNIDDKEKGEIIILDDGSGMNLDILENVWMEPGTNYKENLLRKNQISSEFNRLPIGEKGIGRFGVHKLGNKIELISKKKHEKEVKLKIDWNKFDSNKYLNEEEVEIIEKQTNENNFFGQNEKGTYLRISSLRKEWGKADFRTFYRSAMSLVSPFSSKDDFQINIKSNLNWKHGLININDIKKHALWYFKVTTENNIIDGKSYIKIKEFTYTFTPYNGMTKISSKTITDDDEYILKDCDIKRKKDKETNKEEDISENNKNNYEQITNDGFGNITIEGYLYDFDTKTLNLSDISDRSGIRNYVKENGGIRVYRDDMRIYNYGEFGDDWLGLDQSRINAPTSKIGNKLILASISLSRSESKGLQEKTNREGFIENEVFNNFRDSVIFILNKVNFLRNIDKDKIRKIYQNEVDIEESTVSIIQKIEKKVNNEKVVPLEDDRKQILTNLKKIETNYSEMKDTLLKSAGSGLAYSLVIHEIEKMISELKNRVDEKNIHELKDLTTKLHHTVESITNLFINSKLALLPAKSVIDKSMKFFKYRVKTHKIEIIQKYSNNILEIECSENFIINALMNLVDNSIYWFKYHEKRLIQENKSRKVLIDIIDFEDKVGIIVADTGFGFSISAETAILPFKTTKIAGDGMGLGLYFVNEIMKIHNGNLKIITNDFEREKLGIDKEFNGAIVILEFYKGDKNDIRL